MSKRSPLLSRQKKAVNAYMKGMNKQDAMMAAGYTESTAKTDAHSVFDREDVKAEIKRMQQRGQRKAEITTEWIIQRLMAIADASLGDILKWDEDGEPFLDYENMNADMKYALSGVNIRKYKQGRGEDAVPVTEMKVEQADKLRALEMLSRHLGIFDDKLTISAEDEMIDKLRAGRNRAGKRKEDGN